MLQSLSPDGLLAMLTAITTLVIISAVWLYLVMRHTRASKINLNALGVSVSIDMTRERREGKSDRSGSDSSKGE